MSIYLSATSFSPFQSILPSRRFFCLSVCSEGNLHGCVCVCSTVYRSRLWVCVYLCLPDHYLFLHHLASLPSCVCGGGVNQGQWGSVGRHQPSPQCLPPTHTQRVCMCFAHPTIYMSLLCLSQLSSVQLSSAPWINYWGIHHVSDLHCRTN